MGRNTPISVEKSTQANSHLETPADEDSSSSLSQIEMGSIFKTNDEQ